MGFNITFSDATFRVQSLPIHIKPLMVVPAKEDNKETDIVKWAIEGDYKKNVLYLQKLTKDLTIIGRYPIETVEVVGKQAILTYRNGRIPYSKKFKTMEDIELKTYFKILTSPNVLHMFINPTNIYLPVPDVLISYATYAAYVASKYGIILPILLETAGAIYCLDANVEKHRHVYTSDHEVEHSAFYLEEALHSTRLASTLQTVHSKSTEQDDFNPEYSNSSSVLYNIRLPEDWHADNTTENVITVADMYGVCVGHNMSLRSNLKRDNIPSVPTKRTHFSKIGSLLGLTPKETNTISKSIDFCTHNTDVGYLRMLRNLLYILEFNDPRKIKFDFGNLYRSFPGCLGIVNVCIHSIMEYMPYVIDVISNGNTEATNYCKNNTLVDVIVDNLFKHILYFKDLFLIMEEDIYKDTRYPKSRLLEKALVYYAILDNHNEPIYRHKDPTQTVNIRASYIPDSLCHKISELGYNYNPGSQIKDMPVAYSKLHKLFNVNNPIKYDTDKEAQNHIGYICFTDRPYVDHSKTNDILKINMDNTNIYSDSDTVLVLNHLESIYNTNIRHVLSRYCGKMVKVMWNTGIEW